MGARALLPLPTLKWAPPGMECPAELTPAGQPGSKVRASLGPTQGLLGQDTADCPPAPRQGPRHPSETRCPRVSSAHCRGQPLQPPPASRHPLLAGSAPFLPDARGTRSNPPAQRRSRPGGGSTTGSVDRSRLLEEGRARPYVPHPELGTGPGRVGLSGRRPTAQETSPHLETDQEGRTSDSPPDPLDQKFCYPALCGLKLGFQSSKGKGLAWALCSCWY